MSKYIEVKLTEDQRRIIIEALNHWSKVVDLTKRGLTAEEKAYNAFIDRTIDKLAKAKTSTT